MTDYTALAIRNAVEAMPGVEQVKPWNDRLYVTLSAVAGSTFKSDRNTKIWLRGTVLTIEKAKGYASDTFIDGKVALIALVEASGGSVREI